MTQHFGTAVVARSTSHAKSTAAKRIARMVGVGAVSMGMVGVFAFPAYAVPETQGLPDAYAASQTFTAELAEGTIPTGGVSAELIPVVEAPAAAPVAALQSPAGWLADIPAGAGAQGLVNAALAQLGVRQECTDLVQNSLAAIGMTTSRLNGGPDLGVRSFSSFGHVVTDGNYAPGDILLWPGAPHAAIYIGNGQAVHGGYGGLNTVVAGYASPNSSPTVIRVG